MLLLNKAGCEAGGRAGGQQAAATYGEVVRGYPDTKWACDAEVALGVLARDRRPARRSRGRTPTG